MKFLKKMKFFSVTLAIASPARIFFEKTICIIMKAVLY